jgi:hypothetical protein
VTQGRGHGPIPFVDLSRTTEAEHAAIHEALDRVLRSGRMLLGRETEAWEEVATPPARPATPSPSPTPSPWHRAPRRCA